MPLTSTWAANGGLLIGTEVAPEAGYAGIHAGGARLGTVISRHLRLAESAWIIEH